MVVIGVVRPPCARGVDGIGAVVVSAVAWAWERMNEEDHGTPGVCQALRRNKANDFRWMQLKPIHLAYSARVMKTLFWSSTKSPKGAHGRKPARAYRACAGAKYAIEPVSRLRRAYPRLRASASM